MDGLDDDPIPRVTSPSLRVSITSRLIDSFTLYQQVFVPTFMALRGRDESNGAMAMFIVVPLHQAHLPNHAHPLPWQMALADSLVGILRS